MPLRKVAIWYNLGSGGSKRQVYNHVKGLQSRGIEVELFRPPVPSLEFLPLADLAPETEIPLERPEIRNLPLPLKIGEMKSHQARRIEAMDQHCMLAAERIRKSKSDLLFANTCLDFAAPRLARHLNEIPKSVYLAEPSRALYEALPRLPWEALPDAAGIRENQTDKIRVDGLRLLVREERLNVEAFDQVLVNSIFSAEAIRRVYDAPSEVCYLGIDHEFFTPPTANREAFVLSVGSFNGAKNPELVIRSVAHLPTEVRVPLVWIANTEDSALRQRLSQLARDLEVDLQIVKVAGDDELKSYYQRAQCLVYAPLNEPFGLVPLEASACELPIVGVERGGVRETVKHEINGLLTDESPESLGEALLQVLTQPKLAESLGKAGRKRILENWTLNHGTDRLIHHLSKLA